jgi:hypothetical protein
VHFNPGLLILDQKIEGGGVYYILAPPPNFKTKYLLALSRRKFNEKKQHAYFDPPLQ